MNENTPTDKDLYKMLQSGNLSSELLTTLRRTRFEDTVARLGPLPTGALASGEGFDTKLVLCDKCPVCSAATEAEAETMCCGNEDLCPFPCVGDWQEEISELASTEACAVVFEDENGMFGLGYCFPEFEVRDAEEETTRIKDVITNVTPELEADTPSSGLCVYTGLPSDLSEMYYLSEKDAEWVIDELEGYGYSIVSTMLHNFSVKYILGEIWKRAVIKATADGLCTHNPMFFRLFDTSLALNELEAMLRTQVENAS